MANPEHLAKLEEGISAWNRWREDNPPVQPDLRGAKLRHKYLAVANMIHARLEGADLSGATIDGAILYASNFSGADLRGASLIRTHLSSSNFHNADLQGAILGGTVFGGANLAKAKNLDDCTHRFPSVVDFETIRQSWPLPLAFLRGCGLPDTLIDYLPSLLDQPIQFYSCFISYSTEDQAFADRLHADLQNKGVRCWFAPEDLKIGDRFRQRIDEAIRLHEKLLVILSEHSVRSDWVREEVESCLERESREKKPVLFPVRLDDTVLETEEAWAASIRRQRHIGDFRAWKKHDAYQKALERLLRDLKAENIDGARGL
jgi:hypothetical protein